MSKLHQIVDHYKRKLERFGNDDAIVIDTLFKLSKIPLTVELLQETGICSIVGVLSKRTGRIGEKALNIFSKWNFLKEKRRTPVKTSDHVIINDRVNEILPSNSSRAIVKPINNAPISNYNGITGHEKTTLKHRTEKDIITEQRHKDFTSSSDKGYDFHNEMNRPSTSSSLQRNGDPIPKSFHQDPDTEFNPHLNIDSSENIHQIDAPNHDIVSLNSSDNYKCSKIVHPYSIEMKEGMFRVVKVKSKNSVSASITRVKQMYLREIMECQRNARKDRVNNGEFKNDNSDDCFSLEMNTSSPSSREEKESSAPNVNNKDKKNYISAEIDSSSTKQKMCTPEKSKDKTPLESSLVLHNQEMTRSREVKDRQLCNKMVEKVKKDKIKEISGSLSQDKVEAQKFTTVAKREHNSPNVKKAETPNDCDKKSLKRKADVPATDVKFASSKKDRTTVFSGKKNVRDPLSLKQSCIRIIKKNIESLRFRKKVPYELLKPILEHCAPLQLHKFEQNNKHLMKETGELWRKHCLKDYKNCHPSKNEPWRDVYWHCRKEQEKKLKRLATSISASTSKSHNADRQITVVDSPMLNPQNHKRMKSGIPESESNSAKSGSTSKSQTDRQVTVIDPSVVNPQNYKRVKSANIVDTKNNGAKSVSASSHHPDRHVAVPDSPMAQPQNHKRLKSANIYDSKNNDAKSISSSNPPTEQKVAVNVPTVANPQSSHKRMKPLTGYDSEASSTKTLPTAAKVVTLQKKPVKKGEAPLMSKVKKSMGLAYRPK